MGWFRRENPHRREARKRERADRRLSFWQKAKTVGSKILWYLGAILVSEALTVGFAVWSGIQIQFNLSALMALLFPAVIASAAAGARSYGSDANDAAAWRGLRRALQRPLKPDSGHLPQRIKLCADNTNGIFESHAKHLVGNGEVMLILEQRSNDSKPGSDYHIKSMQEQIKYLEDNGYMRRFEWVCYVTRDGECVAYQDFPRFYVGLMINKKQAYERILNITDRNAFIEELSNHRLDHFGGDIPGLRYYRIGEMIDRKESLVLMTVCGLDDPVMLQDANGRPVGVASAATLMRETFLDNILPLKEQMNICELYPAETAAVHPSGKAEAKPWSS
jgi:hypothetical protein